MKARLEEEVGGLQTERDSLAARLQEAQERLGEMRYLPVPGQAVWVGPPLTSCVSLLPTGRTNVTRKEK